MHTHKYANTSTHVRTFTQRHVEQRTPLERIDQLDSRRVVESAVTTAHAGNEAAQIIRLLRKEYLAFQNLHIRTH